MITKDKITEIFCIADDFCKEFESEIDKIGLPNDAKCKHRLRKWRMSKSEIGRQAFAWILHLRVGECEPYFLHLVGGKKAVDDFDAGTQKSHIGQVFVQCLLCTRVYSRSFYVYPDEVDVRIEACQPHGVFVFSTTQFQDDGVVVVKILFAPMPFHIEWHFAYHTVWILEYILKCFHLCKFL